MQELKKALPNENSQGKFCTSYVASTTPSTKQ